MMRNSEKIPCSDPGPC